MNFTSISKTVGARKIALEEALTGSKVINVEDEPMKVSLITDKYIMSNGLKKVDNPIYFEKGEEPTVGGLFSYYIFGTTQDERKRNYAYIDLRYKFFHPYVFEVLKKLYRNVDKIAAGESAWFINTDGTITEIKDENDPRYDEDNTGLLWLIENYHKIKFMENDTTQRKENIKFIKSLSDDEIFITKWLVIPPFYRDVDKSSGRPAVHELNYNYNTIIKYVNSLSGGIIGFFNNKAMYNIQLELIKIRKYGQSLIESKHGAFHQTVLGKSVDFGMRSVISVPVMNHMNKPEDCQVDIFHTGVPLAQCCVLGYPFMSKWCLDFFRQEFENVKTKTVYIKNSKTGEVTQTEVPIKNQLEVFTKDFIDKKMNSFKNTYGSRFETIKVILENGKEAEMLFTGRGMSKNITSVKSATISRRPMTWTDLFYIAAVECLSDKHVYCTRYPLT